MANWMVLICAVMASLAAGVAMAYGVCVTMFSIFRVHARSVAAVSRQTAIAGS